MNITCSSLLISKTPNLPIAEAIFRSYFRCLEIWRHGGFFGGIWNHEIHEGTRKRFLWFKSLGDSDLLEDNNPYGCGIVLLFGAPGED